MNNLRNFVQLIGNVGRDPEVKKLEKGIIIANTSVATNERYKNADGEYVNHVTWHRITGWDKMASRMEKALKKGEVDRVRIIWDAGYEDYEVYNLDFFINQFKCLNK